MSRFPIPFARFAVICLHLIVILSMLLSTLPVEARASNRIDRMERIEEAATVETRRKSSQRLR